MTGKQNTGKQNAGKQNAGKQCTGEQTAGEQSAGEQTAGEQTAGEQTAGEESTSRQPTGELGLRLPSPLVEIFDERLGGVRLLLKRDDLIHPDFPGTKWRKLKYNIAAAAGRPILTFGGTHSSHLLATAAAGHHLGFRTIGVVRGEERPSPVLAQAAEHGMTLKYISRSEYRTKTEPGFEDGLHAEFGDFRLVPEGGANAYGLRGCAELMREIDADFEVFCCAAGTGTTLAGVATALRPGQRAIGFSALKGGAFLNNEITRLQEAAGQKTASQETAGQETASQQTAVQEKEGNWSIETGFHFGGYARRPPALDAFIDEFHNRHGIVLDRVYEAKMMFGLYANPPGGTVVALIA